MNLDKLKKVEELFLQRHPNGMSGPEFDIMRKKHKPEKMHSLALEYFAADQFDNIKISGERMKTFISRSSLVSVFEKVKFKDHIVQVDSNDKKLLVNGVKEFLHGKQDVGFAKMIGALLPYKMAKWTILSAFGVHYYPDKEVLIKPTTVKNTMAFFELEDSVPKYSPTPSFEFYRCYRDAINKMKKQVSLEFAGGNPEFQGFLMMCQEMDSM